MQYKPEMTFWTLEFSEMGPQAVFISHSKPISFQPKMQMNNCCNAISDKLFYQQLSSMTSKGKLSRVIHCQMVNKPTVSFVVQCLNLLLLWSIERISDLAYGVWRGQRTVKEITGTGFLHHLRSSVTTKITEAIITKNDWLTLHLSICNYEIAIYNKQKNTYRHHHQNNATHQNNTTGFAK